MIRFIKADAITTQESASSVLSKYDNKEVEFHIDSFSFNGTIIKTSSDSDGLHVKFTWKNDGNDSSMKSIQSAYTFIHSKIGKDVKFQVNTDQMYGQILSATKTPPGATVDQYADSPFEIALMIKEQDQKIASGDRSGCLTVPVPGNIASILGCDPDAKYPPHITVAYFPSCNAEKLKFVKKLVKEIASELGVASMEFAIRRGTTFQTKQDDGKYPFVGLVDSSVLRDFHNAFVTKCEEAYPGFVSLEFSHKNYTPHVTLNYVKDPSYQAPVKPVAWSIHNLSLSNGPDNETPISLGVADHGYSYSRLAYVAAVADSRGLTQLSERIADLLRRNEDEEEEAYTWEKKEDKEKEESPDPGEGEDREGDDDKEGSTKFPGTDHHIVTYVKAPQTQTDEDDSVHSLERYY